MAGLNEWSTTAGSNASVGSINFSEGQLPSTVNNSSRQLMTDVAEVREGTTVLSGWHVKANGFTLHDQADTTKKVIFDCSAVSSGSVRTLAYPNTAGTIALTSDITSPESINSKAAETVPATGDLVPFHSASAGAERKITLANLLKVVNSLTEDTTPASSSDFVLTYSASAGAVRKVKPVNLGSGNRVLLTTLTASSSTSLPFTSVNSTLYSGYEFEFDNIAPATDGASLYARFSIDGGTNYRSTAGDYHYAGFSANETGASGAIASTSAQQILISGSGIGNSTNEKLSGTAKLVAPDVGNTVMMLVKTGWLDATPTFWNMDLTARFKGTTDDVDGILFLMSSGNIASGTIRVYGIRK